MAFRGKGFDKQKPGFIPSASLGLYDHGQGTSFSESSHLLNGKVREIVPTAQGCCEDETRSCMLTLGTQEVID